MISSSQARDIHTSVSAQDVIKKDPHRVITDKPRIPKHKIFRSNPLRKSQILSGTDPYDAVDDEDYIFARNRNKIEVKKINPVDDDEALSDHVRWRLFLARQLALLKYREKWADYA